MKPNIKLIRDDTDYVSSFVNGVEYKISKKEDNDLIMRSEYLQKKYNINKKYLFEISLPKVFVYNLWIHIYQLSDYNCYYDPIFYLIAESKRKLKFYQWRAKWKRRLFSFLQF